MAKINSKKIFQEILSCKGKIQLFKEYITYYGVVKSNKTAEKRADLVLAQKQAEDAIEFYCLSDEEVFNTISSKTVKTEEERLSLEFRKVREECKRAVEASKMTQEEADAKISEKEVSNKEALEAFIVSLREQISAEKAGVDVNECVAKLAALKEKHAAELAHFDEVNAVKNEKAVASNTAKYEKKIAKLEAKLASLEEKNKIIQESLAEKAEYLGEGNILKVDDLCMYFGGLHAVDHLSFEVKEGEIFGLIGPNGAGKTTAFNCITQFNKCTAGEITFRTKENDIIDLNKEEVHNVISLGIARTFQNVEVIPECTVLENLLIAAGHQYQSTLLDHFLHTSLLKLEETVITQRAFKILQYMGLSQYAYNFASGLPYGVLKKIEIARTLMTNPQLIVLDEPAAGLNDSETKELSKLIKQIQIDFNCSILLVEHDMGLVMSICDRICCISFGKLLGIGTPSEIKANKAVQEAYLGAEE